MPNQIDFTKSPLTVGLEICPQCLEVARPIRFYTDEGIEIRWLHRVRWGDDEILTTFFWCEDGE